MHARTQAVAQVGGNIAVPDELDQHVSCRRPESSSGRTGGETTREDSRLSSSARRRPQPGHEQRLDLHLGINGMLAQRLVGGDRQQRQDVELQPGKMVPNRPLEARRMRAAGAKFREEAKAGGCGPLLPTSSKCVRGNLRIAMRVPPSGKTPTTATTTATTR